MEKELVMRKHVIQEVCLSALEVEPQVKDDVFVIERKSEYASSAVQYIYNEMNRLVDYSNSRFGQTFIQMHFPEYADDKELALDIADFYWVLLELERRGKEIDEDELIGSIKPEVDDFFRNFFLERHLKELAKKIEKEKGYKGTDALLRLFKGNEELMNTFISECREQSLIPKDVAHKYKMLKDRVIQKEERGMIKKLHKELYKLGIVTIQYPTFQDYF